jgi:hypothetical protein
MAVAFGTRWEEVIIMGIVYQILISSGSGGWEEKSGRKLALTNVVVRSCVEFVYMGWDKSHHIFLAAFGISGAGEVPNLFVCSLQGFGGRNQGRKVLRNTSTSCVIL